MNFAKNNEMVKNIVPTKLIIIAEKNGILILLAPYDKHAKKLSIHRAVTNKIDCNIIMTIPFWCRAEKAQSIVKKADYIVYVNFQFAEVVLFFNYC